MLGAAAVLLLFIATPLIEARHVATSSEAMGWDALIVSLYAQMPLSLPFADLCLPSHVDLQPAYQLALTRALNAGLNKVQPEWKPAVTRKGKLLSSAKDKSSLSKGDVAKQLIAAVLPRGLNSSVLRDIAIVSSCSCPCACVCLIPFACTNDDVLYLFVSSCIVILSHPSGNVPRRKGTPEH